MNWSKNMKAKNQKPVVMFVFAKNRGPKSTRFGGFVSRLKKAGQLEGFEARMSALEDMVFSIDYRQRAQVTVDDKPIFDDCAFVYFKSWETMPEQASALAQYLQAKGIPLVDEAVLEVGTSKLSQLFKLWQAGLDVTPTVYSTKNLNQEIVQRVLGVGPYIVKPAHGQKGRDNYLTKDFNSANKIIKNAQQPMLLQSYIENEGDYRVLVYGYKVRGALYRTGISGSHLNNTSAGAQSEFVTKKTVPENIAKLAINSAKATKNAVAGVDILVSSKTSQPFLLEVNQGSQIVTGHFTDKKIRAFGKFLNESINGRMQRKANRLQTIGRHIRVSMPELGVRDILGKVDTGAYQSALHAENIMVDNQNILHCNITYTSLSGKPVVRQVSFRHYDIVSVTNTSGKPEQRYRIKTLVSIAGKEYRTPLTLTNRGSMKSPMLLGRRLLRGRFLINPELSRKAFEESL
jgi:glutathione synthase/RimK-type ligase-like ATP-grasp enzyme